MKTFCSIRNGCPGRSRLRPGLGAVALAAAGLVWVAGCSDDVVCADKTTPYIVARVEEVGAGRAGSTQVEVYCASDPRMSPGSLSATIAQRQLSDPVEAEDQVGFLMTLSDTQIVWQTGTSCPLEVTTEFGIATSQEAVPGSFEVTAPETVTVGEPLTLSWTASNGADYYRVQAALDGTQGTTELDIAVSGTSVSLDATEVGSAGVFSGVVWAVAGRFPQSGAEGNVADEGWGYYSIAYRDSSGDFEVVVLDSAALR